MFKIDHDDSTVKHILSHLNTTTTTQEQSNDKNLIYRHRGGHGINYVLVFDLFTIIFPLEVQLRFIGISKNKYYENAHQKVP